jgi:DNA/RNA endonuclease YhcR with UshA esterase domain
MNIRNVFVLLASFFCLGVFLFVSVVNGDNVTIVISEIGAYESSGHEWIEIVNVSNDAVDLTDWVFWEGETNHGLVLVQGEDVTLAPNEYALIVQNDTLFLQQYPAVTTTIFDSSWGSLNEGGELIGLKNAEAEMVEEFVYVSSTNFSLERKDLFLSEYGAENWQEHENGNSVGVENVFFADDVPIEIDDVETPPVDDVEDDIDDVVETPPVHNGIIIINEFVSNPDVGNEWVELYNAGTTTVDLTNWELHDGVGLIANVSSTLIAMSSFFVVELSSAKLNNSGDKIILLNASGTVANTIVYGDWEESTVIAPGKGESVARILDGGAEISITTAITKGEQNNIVLPHVDTPSSVDTSPPAETQQCCVFTGDIVINELVSDPADDQEEFIELFNTTNASISLDGWSLEEGSESVTQLEGNIGARDFFVIEKPRGNLNNAGDIIILFDPSNQKIDQVTYGTWDDGNVANNAPAAKDPMSIVRKVDGQDSDNDIYDFSLTETITSGAANIVSMTNDAGDVQILADEAGHIQGIKINEVFPNPAGSDAEEEFIEIKNTSEITVDISGWKLGDSSKKRYTITQGQIVAGGFLLLKRAQTGIALNNTGGEEVALYTASDRIVEKIAYTGSAKESESYARREDNTWGWTTSPTPNTENIVITENAAPVIVIDVDTEVAVGESVMFDASDTTDPDGDAMIFAWNFADVHTEEGGVVEYIFLQEGVYTVTLAVSDTQGNLSEQDVIITVKSKAAFVGGYPDTDPVEQIVISEFVPNPEGSDATEFIELYNPTEQRIDLSGIKLDDEEGGSRGYTFPDKTYIEAGEYKIFGKQETHIALNNTSDAVRLLYPDGSIIHEVIFDDVIEGASYIEDVDAGVWVWTGTPTPGKENIITEQVIISKKRSVSKSKSKRVKPTIHTTLEKIRDEDIGDRVQVTGMVAVEPGVLGSQYFYIVNSISSSTGSGVQVYMFKKDFPKLVIGDKVTVEGELSEIAGETRLKTKEKKDIQIIEQGEGKKPIATVIDIVDVGEATEAWLVQVQGEITEIKSSYMYVDDGTEEVKIYFKRGTGIEKGVFQVGDLVAVTGLVSQTRSGFQILPRQQFDIKKTGVSKEFVADVVVADSDDAGVAEKYLTATAGGLTSIIVGLIAKVHGSNAMRLFKRIGGIAAIVSRKKRG